MGLLPYLSAHALDDDYAVVAARRLHPQEAGPSRARIGLAGALVVAVFAVLAVTAAVQTSQDSVARERERQELIAQVKARKHAIDADRRTIVELQGENNRLRVALLRSTDQSRGVLAQRDLLALRSGTSPVHGPGVAVVVDDAANSQSDRSKVLDTDLQTLVNGLWRAGAEAISINGERLTSVTAIRHAGSAITVNFTSLDRPYRILAIGDRNSLPARFADSSSGQAWLDLQRQVGLRFTMTTERSLRLPAAELPDLRYAEAGTTQGKRLP
jgi:uncharacterized protein YlxW (UPF0749 family)